MTTGWGQRNAAARMAAALLAGCGALALTGCEQRPEPRPAYEAAPPPPPAPLAGEPEAAPTAAPSPEASPPPPEAAPALAPPEPGIAPGPAPQGPPPPSSDQGLVAMAPIPNPEDGGPVPPGADRRRHGRAAPKQAWPAPIAVQPHYRIYRPFETYGSPDPARSAPPPPVRKRPAHPAPVRAPSPNPPTPAPKASAPVTPPKPAVRAASVAKPVRTERHERRASKAELRQGKAAASNTTAADADARTEALRSALSTAVAKGAVLTAPKPTADHATDVTLTLPAGFYDTVKTEAGKQAMGDAAASANADATLTGEGYAIIPAGAQAQPLRVGQPTTFHWTVTAPAGAKGPLRADVKVDLLGGGSQVLALGAVDQADAGSGGFRWWGAALLLAVVALGFWWLLRTRSADARIAASRKRARRPDGTINGQRPLDLRPRDEPPR